MPVGEPLYLWNLGQHVMDSDVDARKDLMLSQHNDWLFAFLHTSSNEQYHQITPNKKYIMVTCLGCYKGT
jgi:hypothetical protein